MPELPEVETTKLGIADALLRFKVLKAVVRERRLRWPIAANFEAEVRGRTVRSVERRAKYIVIGFDHGSLILHLGMSGSLRLVKPGTPPRVHDHWDIALDSGWVLRFHDPRRFGSLHWTSGASSEHPLLLDLAPEPLSDSFDADYLYKATRKRNVAIKQLLMNSKVVVGVGNIYASEALFHARVAPRRKAGRITKPEAERLVGAVKEVLAAAIKIGGTTLRDYVNPEGTPGYFRQELFVYERAGNACRVCASTIKHFAQGQRSTYWCSTCQR